MAYRILLSEKIHPDGIRLLESVGQVDIAPDPSEDTIVGIIGEYDAIVVRSSKLTGKMIEAGKRLKVIGRHGIGTDNLDIETANRQQVIVVNTPEANVISVAEHVMGAMLALCKRLGEADCALRKGVFDRPGSLPGLVDKLGYTTLELYGKTVGLIGVGKIARQVAKMCINGFNMKAYGFDAYLKPEDIRSAGVEPCDTIEEVVSKADFVSVHVPLTPGTKDLIDEKIISGMKPTAILINAARGGVVNEQALYNALKQKTIAAAAVDVFAKEPPGKDHPFFELDNILVTPHMAAMSDGAIYRMAIDVAQGVIDVLEGREPKYWFNKRAFEK
jgi:D-3-phosphoglycerate dehydrogenase